MHNKDIRVRYLDDMPYSVYAFTVKNDVDSYDIYVNPRCCYSMQQKAVEHEYEHIYNGDFDKQDISHVQEIEQD